MMGYTFTPDEIFEMAEQIERNGAEFYRQASEMADDADVKKMLIEMSQMEGTHLKTFEQMHKLFEQREEMSLRDKPDDERLAFLQSMADARGYEGKKISGEKLSANESMKDILNIALDAEKESVVFYLGLQGLMEGSDGKGKLEDIILEELSHIRYLTCKLRELKDK